MKHIFGFAGAVVGIAVGLLISFSLSAALLGFSIGLIGGYFVAGLITARQTLLQQDFASLGTLRGRTLNEIIAAVGPYREMTSCTISDRDNAPGFLYTWRERNYLIVLLFDADNICLGVTREVLP